MWCSLPTDEPATLELFDVQGRRRARHVLADLGRGQHAFALGERLELAPGMYWVRLTQGRRAAPARLVAVR